MGRHFFPRANARGGRSSSSRRGRAHPSSVMISKLNNNSTNSSSNSSSASRGTGKLRCFRDVRCIAIACLVMAVVWLAPTFFHGVKVHRVEVPDVRQNHHTVRGGRDSGFRGDAILEGPGPPPDAPVVAFVISLTSLELPGAYSILDAAEVLIGSILRVCSFSSYACDMVALVLPGVSLEGRDHIENMGWTVLEKELPVAVKDIENQQYREHVVKSGCCGADEFLKLYAYALTDYHRVLHLDVDTLLLHPMDELMESDFSLLYTTDPAMSNGHPVLPVQGGFMLVRPDLEVYEKLRAVVRKGDWRKGMGWGGSKIGWFYGGATIQGLLPYYYNILAPGDSLEVDRCVYNHMSDSDLCRSKKYSVVATFNPKIDQAASAVLSIKSVHFTQSCLKPWLCVSLKAVQGGACPSLQHAWLEGRRTIMADRGLMFTEACDQQRYSPIPRV